MSAIVEIEASVRQAVGRFARDVGHTVVRQQLPFALALALTRTARAALTDEQAAMRQVFDRPRPYTLNSMRIEPATKSQLVALLRMKDGTKKQRSAAKYLLPQAVGGARRNKAVETRLEAAGKVPLQETLVPTKAVARDGQGNVARRQFGVAISGLAVRGEGAGRRGFFIARPGNKQKLTPGLYQRVGRYPKRDKEKAGKGKRRAIFLFHDNPHYQSRFDFKRIGQDGADRHLPALLEGALRQAISTARR